MYRVVTVDVMKGGTATVDSIPLRLEHRRTLRRLGGRKRQSPSIEPSLENIDEYCKWADFNFPWTNLPVQDKEGKWHIVWVKVDTGNDGELSLPTSWVTRLGLTLPEESEMQTPDGIKAVKHGTVKVKWRRKEKPVECRHVEGYPPLIGMKLLEGTRATMNFTYPRPAVEFSRIPWSVKFKSGLDTLLDFFRSSS